MADEERGRLVGSGVARLTVFGGILVAVRALMRRRRATGVMASLGDRKEKVHLFPAGTFSRSVLATTIVGHGAGRGRQRGEQGG